jgi:dephospho-CoA kinase
MITFGITGSISVGKSNVTRIFRENGIPVVDGDVVARQLMIPGALAYRRIVSHFGRDILASDDSIKRGALGAIVFNNPDAREELNKIMFPLISTEVKFQIKVYHKVSELVGFDSALIIESGEADNFRPLIVVHCAQKLQLERLMLRNGLTRDEAMARISSQLPQEKKLKFADFTINTSGSIEHTTERVIDIIQQLKKS